MATECLLWEDSYLKECSATVLGGRDAGGFFLDRPVFYAASGGQPADRGVLMSASGDPIPIASASYTDPAKTETSHQPAGPAGAPVKIRETVNSPIDWD